MGRKLGEGLRPLPYLHAKFHLDPSNRLATIHQRYGYGCVNVRSVNNKFDDVMDMFRDHQLTVLGLTETWHDTDSPVFGRCRASGYSAVDRPRIRRLETICLLTMAALHWLQHLVHYCHRSLLVHRSRHSRLLPVTSRLVGLERLSWSSTALARSQLHLSSSTNCLCYWKDWSS